ncbi:MAG: ribonuclease E/G, partial [Hydrogenophaga sp.]|nr:ribonuclease E/G [Hydrogenophaga sp.]
ALRQDRARVQFGSISKFGLLEMSRQRLKPMLSEGSSIPCPRCGGSGHIRDTESSALQILRIIQEESLKDSTAAVLVQVPVEVASFLLNEKRTEITKIELKQRINVLLVPNKSLDTPNYKLERLKHDDPRLDNLDASYKLADEPDEATGFTRRSQERTNKQEPVIKGVLPDGPAPVAAPKPEAPVAAPVAVVAPVAPVAKTPAAAPAEKGFFGWLKGLFGAAPPVPAVADKPVAPATAKTGEREPRSEGRREGGREGGRDGGRDGRGRGGRNASGEARAPREGREPREGGRSNGRGAEGRGPDSRQGEGRNGEGRSNEGREGGRRSESRGEGRSEQRGDNRQGGRRDNRRDAFSTEGAAASEVLLNAVPGELVDAPEAAEGQRRERRPRNDNRRRVAEGSEAASLAPTEGAAVPAALDATGNTNEAPAAEGDADTGGQRAPRERRSRSRDRYGRDRRERAPRDASATDVAPDGDHTDGQANTASASDEPAYEAPVRSSYFSLPVEASPAQAAAAPAPLMEAVPVQATPPAPRPAAAAPAAPVARSGAPAAVAAPRGLPKVQSYTVSIEELNQVAQGSGLEWVNSNAEKVAQVQAAIAAEPKPIHVPREIKPVELPDEGPLVLVETRKDLRNTPLPFETQQG